MVTRREFIWRGAALGLGAAALPVLEACSGGAQRTQQVIGLFESRYPKSTLSASFTDFNSYFQKLNTEAAGGGLPDVIQLGGGYVPQYAGEGLLLDLSRYAGHTIHLGDFEKGQLDQGSVNSRLYAVSL